MANYVIVLSISFKKIKTPIFDAKLIFITPDISFLALYVATWLPCITIHTSCAFNVQPAKKIMHAVKKICYLCLAYI